MLQDVLTAVIATGCAGLVYLSAAARVVKQYERGVVLRLGRFVGGVRAPGFTMIIPFVDRLYKVNMQIVTLPIPAQEGITRDNVTVRVDAVVYFKVVDPANAVIQVEDYRFAVSQMAQTSLRSIIGKSDLDDLLSNREKLNQGLELMIDSPAIGWGVQIDRVEIKDVSLPDTMKRSMARQAEADRDRRARIINADAEFQASKKLAEAAQQMADTPAALQLRLLQTVTAVAAEKNSTLVLPFPVELLRFLEKAQTQPSAPEPEKPRPLGLGTPPDARPQEAEPATASDIAALDAMAPDTSASAVSAEPAGPDGTEPEVSTVDDTPEAPFDPASVTPVRAAADAALPGPPDQSGRTGERTRRPRG
ncbi:slipin family protein [Streptomyces carpinensis]|uniref:SPFH domain-containing protein n=1 Tax=Streptomyces carpinensis TaxID=66369 RepID=A0ABV1VXC4_9ACTN|nr:slipin family protein [Streptomyces carpinensis]